MTNYNYSDFLKDLEIGREFEFVINNQTYHISTDENGYLFTHNEESLAYKNVELLVENVKIHGEDLKSIFENGKIQDYIIF